MWTKMTILKCWWVKMCQFCLVFEEKNLCKGKPPPPHWCSVVVPVMRKFDIDIKIKKIGAGNTMYKYVHPQGLLFKIIIDYIYAKVHPLKKKNIFFFLIKLKFAS